MEISPKSRAGSDVTKIKDTDYNKEYISRFSNFFIKEIDKIVNYIFDKDQVIDVFGDRIIINIKKDGYNNLTGIIIGGIDIKSNNVQKRTISFLNDCGLNAATKTADGEYYFDLTGKNSAARCIEFFNNLWKKLPLATDSYDITKNMDDREYNIYKGNLPSDKVTLSWNFNCCGKDFSYEFYTIDNNHILAIKDNLNNGSVFPAQFPIEPYKLARMLLNDRFIDLASLIDNSDKETLDKIIDVYDDNNPGEYFVRDTIEAIYDIDTPTDEDGEIYTLESVKDVLDFINGELEPYGLITQNNITCKRDVNDARVKKLKKHPELRTQYESKKSFFERLLNE
jgi:hypothetical protein